MQFFTLDESGQPVLELDYGKWAKWFEDFDHIIAEDKINHVRVSTIFLAHGPDGSTPPLWETAVFGGTLDQTRLRCVGNKDQALAQHQETVNKVKSFQQQQ